MFDEAIDMDLLRKGEKVEFGVKMSEQKRENLVYIRRIKEGTMPGKKPEDADRIMQKLGYSERDLADL